MSYTRKCRACEISFPPQATFANCRRCGEATSHVLGAPDDDWELKAETALLALEAGDPVEHWRYQELLRAKFDVGPASLMAADRTIDIHFVVERLLNRGCSHELAYAIAS
jgi:hypothetical protein